jgi:hypothetical protein
MTSSVCMASIASTARGGGYDDRGELTGEQSRGVRVAVVLVKTLEDEWHAARVVPPYRSPHLTDKGGSITGEASMW